jgi:hypothetical protein
MRRWSGLLGMGLLAWTVGAEAQTTILESAARTVSGTAVVTQLANLERVTRAIIFLDVTVAATDAADTLDVYLQHSIDGTIYDDFVHFTQVLGNGSAKQFFAEWSATASPESELHAPQDAGIAAGVLQGPAGATWRLKWVIVDGAPGSADQSFTFSVSLYAWR